MPDISLLASTGNQPVDKILQGIIGTYELVFPGRIRGYYLLGSYTDATSVSISDIDMAILFKGSSVDKREAQVNRCCSLISPIRLDISAHSEERLPAEDVRLKLGSVLLYGKDSRDNIALPPIEAYHQYITAWPCYFFGRIRNIEFLTFPLDYPEPEGDFYGYDRKSIPAWYPAAIVKGTKELVASICWTATAIVALQTGRYTGRKADGIKAYKELIDDGWATFVQDVYQRCKLQWKYLVPGDKDDRKLLSDLCQQTLAFENHYLAIYRNYLLASLHSESLGDRLFAVRRLREVVYSDEKVTNSLYALAAADNEDLREAVKEAIGKIR